MIGAAADQGTQQAPKEETFRSCPPLLTIIHVYNVLLVCDMILPVRDELLLQVIVSMRCACCHKDALMSRLAVRAAALCHISSCITCIVRMTVFTQLHMHASNSLHLYVELSVVSFRQRKKRERDQEEDPGKTTRLTLSLKKNVIPSVCAIRTHLVLLSSVHLLCQPFAVSYTGSSTVHLLPPCYLGKQAGGESKSLLFTRVHLYFVIAIVGIACILSCSVQCCRCTARQ